MSRHSRFIAESAVVAFVVAMFMPWQHTRLGQDSGGFESGGWVALIFVAIAAWALLVGPNPPTRRRAQLATAMAVLATVVCAYLLGYFLTNEESLFGEEVRSTSARLGAYVAAASSLALTVAALFSPRSDGS